VLLNTSRSTLTDVPGTWLAWAIASVPSLHCQNFQSGQFGVLLFTGGDVVPVPFHQASHSWCSPATVEVKFAFALDSLT
jgi:hypothetical protein